MNIAVIGVGYNCKKQIEETICPWLVNRIGGLWLDDEVKFTLSVTTALFKEYADLGAVYNNKETEDYLLQLKENKSIDALNIIKEPILDYQSRVTAWDSVKHLDIDYIWQLDLFDEYYDFKQVKKVCDYLEENPLYDFYRINFRNYFGKLEDKTYVLDFKPVRIINNRRHGGVKNFYFDNDVEFNDGTKTPYCAGTTIPKGICNPKHLSWVGDKEFLTKKIQYQHRAIGVCSYQYNNKLDKLEFNKNYYYKNNIPIPEVYKDV